MANRLGWQARPPRRTDRKTGPLCACAHWEVVVNVPLISVTEQMMAQVAASKVAQRFPSRRSARTRDYAILLGVICCTAVAAASGLGGFLASALERAISAL